MRVDRPEQRSFTTLTVKDHLQRLNCRAMKILSRPMGLSWFSSPSQEHPPMWNYNPLFKSLSLNVLVKNSIENRELSTEIEELNILLKDK
ncbi:hypothetical protein [Desulfosporosinus lacus]|uniref:hypothetical protein n=1 Tax=Desulfosporosinus lacus TaxID=329936 RepID=UPI00116136FB|nr:hypothetical protein [Desulfosporosinus lacus]